MDTEGCELGPFAPASDALALAAVERAERHGTEKVWIVLVAEHLGFKRSAHTTRCLRPQLERLRIAGELESVERLGRECWTLTDAGRERLTSARRDGAVDELPESPQHRRWRHAHMHAAEWIDHFRDLAFDALPGRRRRLRQLCF
jgi:DNA-binding transcriptional regulator PaaX